MESKANDEVMTQRTSAQSSGENQHRGVLVQFIRASATMHHIDELFWWMTQLLVQQGGVQVAQVWAVQATQDGQFFPRLRSGACRDSRVPQQLVVNRHMARLAERFLQARSSSPLQLVETTFPPTGPLPLQQHGLNYCASVFLSGSVLLPPAATDFSVEGIPTPLATTWLLFFQHIPQPHVLPGLSSMLQRIVPIARARGLLLSASPTGGSLPMTPVPSSLQQAGPEFLELIAHRIEDSANNPLAASVAIADEPARRFYAAMNGRRTVGELCTLIRLGREEAFAVVQMLLAQHRIQLYKPSGQLVPSSLILNRE